jgi:uncharacterized protein
VILEIKRRMKPGSSLGGLGAICLLALMAAPACAAPEPVDCSNPSSNGARFICGKEHLAAKDAELQALYKAALAKAEGDEFETRSLLKGQERWLVFGRDACFAGEEPEVCLAAAYADRVSELQTAYGLVTTRPPITFICDDDPALPLTATIYETQPLTVRLERDGAMLEAYEVAAEKGMRFEAEDVLFASEDGKEAQILWIASDLHCTIQAEE